MKRSVLAIFLLMTAWSFCQGGYPKVILFKGDTLVAITPNQMDQINVNKVALDECQTADSLNQIELATYVHKQLVHQMHIDELNFQLSTKDSIVGEKNIQVQELKDDLATEKKNNEKLKKRGKILTFVGTAGGLIVGGAGGFLVGQAIK